MGGIMAVTKNSEIRVDPIRDLKDLRTLKKLLAEKPRDLCMFTLGVNTNLRASDLLRTTVGQVRHLQPGGHFYVTEKKTGKQKAVTINKTVFEAIRTLLATMPDALDSDLLFQSRKSDKNRGKALSVPYFSSLVKTWCSDLNLKGNFGSHTLRKTFGYVHRTVFGTDIPTLMTMYNHSSQKQTLDYLGIQASDVKDAYMREI